MPLITLQFGGLGLGYGPRSVFEEASLSDSNVPLPAAAETVLTFLESVGRRSEAEVYLQLFRGLPKQSFAIIALGGPVLRLMLGSVVEQLRFLADLGLFAPIALGLFDTGNLEQARDRLVRRLTSVGLTASVHLVGEERLSATLAAELCSERIPVLDFSALPGPTERFERLAQISAELETRKLVLLRRRGGLGAPIEKPLELGPGHVLEVHRGVVSVINLRTDTERLLAARRLRKEDAEVLERVRQLLAHPKDRNMLVSIASPLNLLAELFTVKGAGTLVKSGTSIKRAASYSDLELDRLRALLESSFERTLRADFFDEAALAIYYEPEYRGAAVLQAGPIAPFLSKFAVLPVAQGEGIGKDLWQAIVRDHPAIFWRARPDNPIATWYSRIADGMVRLPKWHVFWRGIDVKAIPAVCELAVAAPTDFT